MAQKLNYLLTQGCSLLLWPFQKLPPFWSILFLSLLTSLFVLAVYRAVSDPVRVRNAKNQIKAHILAIRLYRDSWRVIVVSFFKSLFYTGKYFALNLLPLLLAFPLLFLLFVQMDIRFGMRPFRVGEDIVVKARFSRAIGPLDVTLEQGPLFRAAMKPVFIDALGEVNWKLRAVEKGMTNVVIRVDGAAIQKNLAIGEMLAALSNKKMAASTWAHFIYPAEKLLAPALPLTSVALHYPPRSIAFLGLSGHWLYFYLALTMVIALALKNRFGVEF
ncbi:MAG TPA: hypothetical protein VLQ89_03370 [Candidatus Binatia bacterium]|nr:hypothetical protein [Candidatus Binatia bacterium]